MIKLNASYSKKVPAEQDYSSKSFMACVEVELPTGANQQELQQKIHETFDLVRRSVEDEISGTTSHQGRQEKSPQNGSSQPMKASNKQLSFVCSLGKAKNKLLADLNAEVQERFGVATIYELSRQDCSRYIEELKAA